MGITLNLQQQKLYRVIKLNAAQMQPSYLQQQKLYRVIKPEYSRQYTIYLQQQKLYRVIKHCRLRYRHHYLQQQKLYRVIKCKTKTFCAVNLQQQKLYRVIKPLHCMMLHKFQNNLNKICEIVITFSLFNNPIWTKINIKTWVCRSQPTISKGESSFLAKPNFFYVSSV